MYTSLFVQKNGLGGAVHGGRGDFRRGLIRESGRALVAGGKGRSCTLVFLFSTNGLGRAVCDGRRFSMGLDRETREGDR
jgi:hypothetical protein